VVHFKRLILILWLRRIWIYFNLTTNKRG